MINLPSSLAKGEILTFALNKALVTSATSDSYWSDAANIQKCIVVYKSTSGHQRKKLEFDFTQESPTTTAEWSVKARDAFEIEEIVLIDFDSGSYTIPRSSLPSGKGISFAGEGSGGGGSIVTEVVHNYVPNGAINDMVTDGSNVWIGGAFTSLRFMAPYAATISATTAENVMKDQVNGKFPVFNGAINCFAFDGQDTLFVGGSFTSVDGVLRNSIAKLNRVDGAWTPDTTWNSLFIERPFKTSSNAQAGIYSILVSGGTIYLGGNFSTYTAPGASAISANHLVGVNKNTGSLICSITPTVPYGAAKYPTAILEDSGFLYVAFNTGQPVKINKTSGVTDTAFVPNVTNALTAKMSLVLQDESLFIGGCFSSIGGVTKYNIAKVNKNTGVLDESFSVAGFTAASLSSNVRAMVLDASGNLIVAGVFDNITSLGRNIVKLNGQTGARISEFNAQSTFFTYNGSSVETLLISDNSLYGFGNFTGQPTGATNPKIAVNLAKVNATTGEIDSAFKAVDSQLTSAERINFAGFDGQNIMICGAFTGYGGYARQGVAKLNKDSYGNWKVDETFDTSSGGTAVNTLALSGNDLYIGGTFTTWGGQTRNRVAKLNATTGALDASFGIGVFTSGVTTGQFNGVTNTVHKIAVDGETVLIAGAFSTYSKKSSTSSTTSPATPYWIRVDSSTNSETVPSAGASGTIRGIAISGEDIFFCGAFSQWAGANSYRIAKVNKTTYAVVAGFVSPFTSTAPAVSPVSIYVSSNGTVWTFGVFSTLIYTGSQSVGVVAMDRNTGAQVKTYAPTDFGSGLGATDVQFSYANAIERDGYMYIIGSKDYFTSHARLVVRRVSLSTHDVDLTWGLVNTNAMNDIFAAVVIGNEFIIGGDIQAGTNASFSPGSKLLYSIKVSDASQNNNI